MGMNEQIAQAIVSDMKRLWGGALPTWENYKDCLELGRVRVNKTVAAKTFFSDPVPKVYHVFYGVITPAAAILAFPGVFVAWLFFSFSAWWLLTGVVLTYAFLKLTRAGHCAAIKSGARKNKDFYEHLIEHGAFFFTQR
mgnify:CR=1 FL=1